MTYECEYPDGDTEPGPDQGPDVQQREDTTSDANTSGDGVTQSDTPVEEDTAEDTGSQPDQSTADQGEADTGGEDTGEGDTVTMPDTAPDGPDPDPDPDLPLTLCPDHTEPNDGVAVHLHTGELLAGDTDSCGSEVYDPRQLNGCDCGGTACCQCAVVSNLGLCGLSDIDQYEFDLLAGDVAVVRIIPDERVERCDFFGTLTHPDGDTRISTCDEENGRVVSYIRIQPASTADGDPGVIARYSLRVRSSTEDVIPYHLHIQVEPVSRNCPGDSWDDSWADYNSFLRNEAKCIDDACEGSFDTPVHGNICPWDAGDYVSHEITTDYPNSRTIRINFDTATSQMTGTLYRLDVHGNPSEIGRMCASCDDTITLLDGSIKHTFEDLWPAAYQLHVTPNNLVPAWFDVSFIDE